jgi:peptidoglycan hydrolase-like protein with peptidoglycan-binding domain
MSAPIPELAAPARWHASLSASRERRAAAWRRRRRRFRARTLLFAVAIALIVVSAGVALGSSSGSNTLKYGMRGTAVQELQRKLHVRPASGYFGTKTRAAVEHFQRRHGLRADGVAGPATLRRLGMRVNSAGSDTGGTAPSSGGSGSRVKVPAVLRRIAQCESGGNPRAVSRTGRYRGKYQFDQPTWEAWGGSGDPIKASESTQDRVAVRLYHARGTAPWPNCA